MSFLATTLLLAGCELISPPTPEESCLKTSLELVKRNSAEEPDWPIKVTVTSPITTDPVLCKGTAIFQDGETRYIQFYENPDRIAFEDYVTQTCQELAEQVILMGSTESDWPVKLENSIRIDEDPGERLTCKAHASYPDESIDAEAIHEDIDGSVGFRSLPISERECDIVLMRDIMNLTEELSMKSASNQTIIKIYDPIEISNTGDKLTCRGKAKFQSQEDSMIEFYEEKDKDGDRFFGFEKVE